MFRKLLLSTVAATALTGSAFAADLPSRKAPPPAFVPPPVMTWTGAYVGVNGGAIWTNSRNFTTTGTDFGGTGVPLISAVAALTANNNIPTGNRTQFLVGGTWGYNWQLNNWVLGTESDFQGVFGCRNGNNNGFFGNNNGCGGVTTGAGAGRRCRGRCSVWGPDSTDRYAQSGLPQHLAREGWLPRYSLASCLWNRRHRDRARPGEQRDQYNVHWCGTGRIFPGLSTANYSQLKAGFVAGGGLEWMFFKDWSFKAEALYYDLGRSTLNQQVQVVAAAPAGLLLTNTGINTTWRNNGIIARGGLNYHCIGLMRRRSSPAIDPTHLIREKMPGSRRAFSFYSAAARCGPAIHPSRSRAARSLSARFFASAFSGPRRRRPSSALSAVLSGGNKPKLTFIG